MTETRFSKLQFSVILRQKTERAIARRAIADLLAAGYKLSVDNTEGDDAGVADFENLSTDAAEIFGRMFQTDEDYLFVWDAKKKRAKWQAGGHTGWIRFIYGNDGFDVISDYTTNLESVLGATHEMIEQMERGEFDLVATPGKAQ
jgi:hypothetical protein